MGARSIGENIVWIYLPTSLHIIKFLSAAILHWGDGFLQQLMDRWVSEQTQGTLNNSKLLIAQAEAGSNSPPTHPSMSCCRKSSPQCKTAVDRNLII